MNVYAGLKVVPLLLIHGWPGSFFEFYESIPLLQSLAKSHGFSYDIVVPSLPGYGYSEACYKPGWLLPSMWTATFLSVCVSV